MDFKFILSLLFYGVAIFSFLFIWIYFKKKKRENDAEWEEIHKYARELKEYHLKQAEELITSMEATSRIKLQEELDQKRAKHLYEISTEAEREYTRQVALMKEDLSAYQNYIDFELSNLTQEFLNSSLEARNVAAQLNEEVEDTASRLVSLIEAERALLMQKDERSLYTLKLTPDEVEDIQLFLDDILPRVRRKDVVRKVVWVEYIEKPTIAMLNRIVPKECSGVYKITHLSDKKSYIGRSVSVRQRLTQHIKSSLGLGTIADQQVHHAMRQEGLENFMFELLEECEREKLAEREKYYIEKFQANKWGYNMSGGG